MSVANRRSRAVWSEATKFVGAIRSEADMRAEQRASGAQRFRDKATLLSGLERSDKDRRSKRREADLRAEQRASGAQRFRDKATLLRGVER